MAKNLDGSISFSPEPETMIPGTHRIGKDTVFCVNVPVGAEACVLLYDTQHADEPPQRISLEERPWHGTLRCALVRGLSVKNCRYLIEIDGVPALDPAAKAVFGRENFGKAAAPEDLRCGLAETDFDWREDRAPLSIPFEDVVAYHLHVRGFTMAKGSGVRHRGTFLGLQEKAGYLRDLGVNQVILMPAYEFDEILRPAVMGLGAPAEHKMTAPAASGNTGAPERVNYWGYGGAGVCWFAPKRAYCATEDPVREFRTMVRALHEAGIEVIMEISMPDPVDINLLCRCLRWWHIGCHVDGFSLLMNASAARAAAADPALGRAKMISESFGPEDAGSAAKGFRHLARLDGAMRYFGRRLLKGDEDVLGGFAEAVRANPEKIGIYNMITGHNGMTLLDLVSYDRKHNEANGEQNRDGAATEYSWNCGEEGPSKKRSIQALRLRQMKNALAMLLLAQGTPVIRAGDERGNSQEGNNNPYCHDSELTWVDWRTDRQSRELTAFVRELTALRKAHRILHMPGPLAGSDTRSCGYPDLSCHGSRAWYGDFAYENRHIGLLYCGYYGDEDGFVYVAYNLFWEPRQLALPLLPQGLCWEKVLDTADGHAAEKAAAKGADAEGEAAGAGAKEMTVPGRSVSVLLTRKCGGAKKK